MLSVVIVYFNTGNKTGCLSKVMEGFNRQINKDFELIIIDNHSPIPLAEDIGLSGKSIYNFMVAPKVITLGSLPGGLTDIRGQCTARNIGTMIARGDRVTWNDGDCVPSKNFVEVCLRSRADALNIAFDGGKVPGTLSCNLKDVLNRVSWIEENPRDMTMFLQHPSPKHFLNCITRGVSVARSVARYTLFDEDFNYDANNPNSGKGWEDVDFGMRLHKGGAIIDGDLTAFTVHIDHQVSAPSINCAKASYKNWVLLNRKHPDLKLLVPDWHRDTTNAILEGMRNG